MEHMPAFLSHFHPIRPDHEIAQKDLLKWIAKAHAYAESQQDLRSTINQSFFEQRFYRIGLGANKIQSRGMQLQDFLESDWKNMSIYRLHESAEGASITKRIELFDESVSQLFERFYPLNLQMPDHLIHVSCTGYVAPSGAQKIVAKRGSNTTVTHAYHMGCYAALPAIQMGVGFNHSPFSSRNSISEIVHTELCSLHLNLSSHSLEQCVIHTLFADGFIKYRISRQEPTSDYFELRAIHNVLLPKSIDYMSWRCGEFSFMMTLSKDLTSLLKDHLPRFLSQLIQKSKLPEEKVMQEALFAIHPGGPKIIEELERLLKLKPFQTEHSKAILKSCGNMSSATLPHIWEQMLKKNDIPSKTVIISLAFGPGITACGSIFIKGIGK